MNRADLGTIQITLNMVAIYMIECKRCHKQDIGETKRRQKDRFNEHRRPVDKPTNISKPTTVSEHFLTDHLTHSIRTCSLQSRQRTQS